jgi:FAD-linked sulfhydryl oxidase
MHIPPDVWGPFFWHTLHIAALGYPQEPSYSHKKAMKEFFESLQHIIPCPICRDHYASHLSKMPIGPSLDNRKDLFRWTIDLHNDVNEMLGKRKYTETEVIQYYTRLGKRGRSPVVTAQDFMEADQQAMLKGIAAGVAVTAILSGILYFNLPRQS